MTQFLSAGESTVVSEQEDSAHTAPSRSFSASFFVALGLRPSLNKLAAGVYRAMNDAGRFGTRFVSVFGTSSIGVSEKSSQTPAWFGTHHVLTVEAGRFPNSFILIF